MEPDVSEPPAVDDNQGVPAPVEEIVSPETSEPPIEQSPASEPEPQPEPATPPPQDPLPPAEPPT